MSPTTDRVPPCPHRVPDTVPDDRVPCPPPVGDTDTVGRLLGTWSTATSRDTVNWPNKHDRRAPARS